MVDNKQPQWSQKFLDSHDLKLIADAVAKVETNTSGEVVPMIVRSSQVSGHINFILALIFLLIFSVFDLYDFESHYLSSYISNNFFIMFLLLVINIIFAILFVKILSRFNFVQRILTSKSDQYHQVKKRALLEFYNQKINNTKQATGILIFVSLLEKRAIVLGDEAISQKITQKDWQEVIDQLIGGIKNKKVGQGFCQAIEASGKILATHFPIQSNDTNELPNKLVIKE
jgi:putative membrane protein